MDRKDSESPCQELSSGGLESVATLLVRWQIVFRVRVADRQSSCMVLMNHPDAQPGGNRDAHLS